MGFRAFSHRRIPNLLHSLTHSLSSDQIMITIAPVSGPEFESVVEGLVNHWYFSATSRHFEGKLRLTVNGQKYY